MSTRRIGAVDLDPIFKAYDVRGVVPDQLDAEVAQRIGSAFARFTGAGRIAVGHDSRLSSPELTAAAIEGILDQGVDVADLGMVTTDMMYFASGVLEVPGLMVTASHNPKGYNGIKVCRSGAAPVGVESGLKEVKRLAAEPLEPAAERGVAESVDVLDRYVHHLMEIVDPSSLSPLRVAVDGGNGVAGVAIPAVFERTPCELLGLYLEPDGTFPNHHPDPLRPENLRDLEELMADRTPDLGVAFDGDADRAFFVDDLRRPLPGSSVTAIVARWFLDREPGATIVHNLICSRAVPETIASAGGTPVRTRVGHSYIKEVMKETGAVFGGEHSGHYYFRDHFRADSGILTMLILLRVLSEAERSLSELRDEYEYYAQSGEINLEVEQQEAAIAAVAAAFTDAEIDRLDGLTVSFPDKWFNLRPSNTEPVLRLNVEAVDSDAVAAMVEEVRDCVVEVSRGGT